MTRTWANEFATATTMPDVVGTPRTSSTPVRIRVAERLLSWLTVGGQVGPGDFGRPFAKIGCCPRRTVPLAAIVEDLGVAGALAASQDLENRDT